MITILLRIGRNPCKIARGRSAFNPSYSPSLDCGPTELHLTTPPHLLRAARVRRTCCAVALAPLLLIGCRDGYAAFGAGARARSTADQLLAALADRHVDLAQNGKYEYSRMQIMRGALSPSRVFDDTAVWTGASGDVRILESFGSHLDGHYRLDSRAGAPMPTKPADARHVITLSRLAEKEYRWDTTVDFALGAIRPVDVASLVTRLLASGEGRSEAELRSELATLSPRSSAALGTLFTLDSLRPVALADGSTSVTLGASVHSDNLRPRFPAFADYAHRYVDPARFHVVLTDRAGVPFFDAAQKDRVVTVRVRTLHGRLIPLSGPARPLPDSLQLHVDLNVKVKIFHVGFHNLVMDFTNDAVGDEERDWTVTARREPQWDLPLISARLLRSPLRRPFAGEGSLFRLGVRAGEGNAPTVLLRHSRLPVQESAILNFLNSLSGTAMGDFGGVVEREENAWLRELFLALRADARGGIPGP